MLVETKTYVNSLLGKVLKVYKVVFIYEGNKPRSGLYLVRGWGVGVGGSYLPRDLTK